MITLARVNRAIRSFKSYKAAGADGIHPQMLKNAGPKLTYILRNLLRGSLKTGTIPDLWKTANVVFIPKPGKDSYELPKSFRPISLTSFLLKTMEKVIDYHLSDEKFRPYHKNQHAYRPGRSTETALHNLVARIEKPMHNRQFALCIFLDILSLIHI